MNGEHFEDLGLRIIDDKLFARVQALRDGRRHFGPKGVKTQQLINKAFIKWY